MCNPILASHEEWAKAYFDMVGKMESFLVRINEETDSDEPNAEMVLRRIRRLSTEALRVIIEGD